MREARHIVARPGLMLMLVPFPLLLFAALAMAFHVASPHDLPVAVVDQNHSTLSRQIVRLIDATPEVAVAAEVPTLTEGRQLMIEGRAYAVVLIPPNTDRDVLAGRQPEVAFFYNYQMLTPGSLVARAISGALQTVAAGIAIEERVARGADVDSATAAVNPIPVRQSQLFNPSLDYIQFLLAAIFPTVLQIFIATTAALSFAREKHNGAGLGYCVRLGRSPMATIAGKLAPYTICYIAVLWAADAVLVGLMGADFNGDLGFHIVSGILFVLAAQLLGATAALAAPSSVIALAAVSIITGPAFGFTGVTLPSLSMNGFSALWAQALPVNSYLLVRIDNVVRGAPIALAMPELLRLVGLIVIYGGLTVLLLWWQSAGGFLRSGSTKPC
jgi:ABC-2 type transport system permease protein